MGCTAKGAVYEEGPPRDQPGTQAPTRAQICAQHEDTTYGHSWGESVPAMPKEGPQPTQLAVDPDIVNQYSESLKKGERVPPIEVVLLPDGREFITEGHHRYVASQKTGIPVEKRVFPDNGPIGFTWLGVKYEKLNNG